MSFLCLEGHGVTLPCRGTFEVLYVMTHQMGGVAVFDKLGILNVLQSVVASQQV